MKTIVAGSRTYNNYDAVESVLDRCPWDITEVVSGECRGADQLGEEWAGVNAIPVMPFPYLSKLGIKGGPVRNRQMAEYAEAAVVFWDGRSTGTKSMINLSLEHGLHLLVVRI